MTDEEYNQRVKALIPTLSQSLTANGPQTEELFLLYNYRFSPQENGKHCAACRSRVYNRLKQYYDTIKDA